ncbi:FG-GAP repeat domain-containing protein [Paenibacillus herberti]|uniref:VCBS repeat-containing protein n=1 Tax=Paenibacillus herberti TaxID=1619309 RepID=A0A229NVS8_9BACL|nr:VCBS repeat-containing protein [Paenibacillus herberti]OXM13960.1 hypothetical protein CGZ75_13205 [Paenibacillus herberti]
MSNGNDPKFNNRSGLPEVARQTAVASGAGDGGDASCPKVDREHPSSATGVRRYQPNWSQSTTLKKRSKIKLLVVLAAFIFVMAGCRYTAAPADLLGAPETVQQAGGVTAKLRDLLPVGSSLSLPARERQSEAIRSIDMDGDGKQEAVLTYVETYGSSRLMIARQEAGEWKPWAVLRSGVGVSLEWLSFVDMNGDKRPELIAGWAVNQPGNTLSWQQYEVQVYSMLKPSFEESEEGRLLKPIAELSYEWADTGDVDGNGKQELVLIRRPDSPNKPQLEVYRLGEGDLVRSALLPLQSATFYEGLAIGKIAKNKYGVIVEGIAGAQYSVSLMAVWINEGLQQVYPPSNKKELGYSTGSMDHTDINGDGILEWREQVPAPGQSATPSPSASSTMLNSPMDSNPIYYTEWTQWNGDLASAVYFDGEATEMPPQARPPKTRPNLKPELRLEPKLSVYEEMFLPISLEYNDYKNGISVQIPSRWRGQFTLSRPSDDNSLIIQLEYYNAKSGRRAPLWTLYGVPIKEWDSWSSRMEGKGRKLVSLRTVGGIVYSAVEEKKPTEEDGWPKEELNRYVAMRMTHEQLASSLRLLPSN